MGLKAELERAGLTKVELAKFLSVSRQTVMRMGDEVTPEVEKVLSTLITIDNPSYAKYLEDHPEYNVQHSNKVAIGVDLADEKDESIIVGKPKDGLMWSVRGDKVTWLGSEFGHGSEWDYNYSAAKIFHIRRLLEQIGTIQGVMDFCNGIFENSFIQDVSKNCVCPNIPGFDGFG